MKKLTNKGVKEQSPFAVMLNSASCRGIRSVGFVTSCVCQDDMRAGITIDGEDVRRKKKFFFFSFLFQFFFSSSYWVRVLGFEL